MSDLIPGLKFEEDGLSSQLPVKHFVRTFETDKMIRLHYHRSLEINICRDVEGIIRLGGAEHSIARNCIIVLPPESPHSYRILKSEGSIEVFHFMIKEMPGLESALNDTLQRQIIPLADCSAEAARQFTFFRKKQNITSHSALRMSGALMILVDELCGKVEVRRPESLNHRSDDFLYKVINYVEKNYGERISLNDVSGYTGTSKYHFSRLFKKITGESWSFYLKMVRLSNSLLLLKQGTPVIDTASACGFESDSYYIKCFKIEYGMTPLQWRKNTAFTTKSGYNYCGGTYAQERNNQGTEKLAHRK
ncbi:MAG TPA: hypothetical protein DCO79_11280 [Spirochaeta sp.]|nr:hypothetical protein [Spirochaeta sp.]